VRLSPLFGLAALAAAPLVIAQAEGQRSLRLQDAIVRILAANPSLAAETQVVRAAQARRETLLLRPPLAGGVDLENFAGTGQHSGTDALEATLRLSGVIELGNKHELRRHAGDGEVQLAEARREAAQLDLLSTAARRFLEVVADQERLVLARRAATLAQRSAAIVEERAKAGAASGVDRNRAQLALAKIEIAREHAEHELAAARVTLAALWGLREPDFDRADANLYDLPAPQELAALEQRLEQSPDIIVLAGESRLQAARAKLAAASRHPDLALSGGVRQLEQSGDQALVVTLSVPLFSGSRGAPARQEAEATRDGALKSLEARRLELHATLFEVYQELLHARTEVGVLRERALPRAEENLALLETGYRLGRYSYLELSAGQAQVLELQRELLDAARDYHDFLIEIERLTALPAAAAGVSP
jgi:outer membrane protein, heavy metal efflux system